MGFGDFLSGWYGDVGGNAPVPSYIRHKNQKSPGELGEEQAEFMNAAYPGTNPWEQLGAAGASNHSAAAEKNRLQKQQFSVQKDIAKLQTDAQVQVAEIQAKAQLGAAGIPFNHPLGAKEKEAGIDKDIAQALSLAADIPLKQSQTLLNLDLKLSERFNRFLMHERGLTERHKRASLQQGIDESKAKENLIGKQTTTEEKRPDNIQADTDLKGSQKGLVDKQQLTEEERPANVRADTRRANSQAELADQQADTEVERRRHIREQANTEWERRRVLRSERQLKEYLAEESQAKRMKILMETGLLGFETLYEYERSQYYATMAYGDRNKALFSNAFASARIILGSTPDHAEVGYDDKAGFIALAGGGAFWMPARRIVQKFLARHQLKKEAWRENQGMQGSVRTRELDEMLQSHYNKQGSRPSNIGGAQTDIQGPDYFGFPGQPPKSPGIHKTRPPAAPPRRYSQ